MHRTWTRASPAPRIIERCMSGVGSQTVALLIVLQKLSDVPPSCHTPSSIFFLSVSLKTRVQRETRCLERGSCSLSGHRCILCRRMSLMATLGILSFRCWMQMSARRLRDAKRGDKWRHSFTNSCCFSMCSSASRHLQPSAPHMSHTDRVYIIHHTHIQQDLHAFAAEFWMRVCASLLGFCCITLASAEGRLCQCCL